MNKLKFIMLASLVLCTTTTELALAVETDVVSKIVLEFHTQTEKWYDIAQNFARTLFYWIIVLEVAYIGIRGAMGTANMGEVFKQFVMAVLTAGFFLAVIENYQEWTDNIISGLYNVAGQMTQLHKTSDLPLMAGIEMVDEINKRLDGMSFWSNGGEIIVAYLACFIILICFALITAKIVLIKCEAMIATVAALILVPLGASTFFRDYSINTLRYIFSVAFKLYTMLLVTGVGFGFINDITATSEFNFGEIAVIIGFTIVLLALSYSIPEAVAGIISGSHIGGGASLMNAASAMRGATRAMGTGALGAAGGAIAAGSAVKGSYDLAKAQGATGLAETAKGMGKNLWDARGSVNAKQTSIGNEIQERLAALKLSKP